MAPIATAPVWRKYLLLQFPFQTLKESEKVQTQMESEVAALIVEGLNLEIPPEEIDPLAPLFGEGLSLDSIDALEVALLVSKTFGITIAQGDSKNHEIFTSLQTLSDFIVANRKH